MKLKSRKPFSQRGVKGEGTLKFQVTGMIEGLFGSEIFDSGIFSGRKTLFGIFWVALLK